MRTKQATTMAVAIAMLALGASEVNAATLDVKWDDVKTFTDLEAVDRRQDTFQTSVVEGLTAHLQELARQLPTENNLQVTFHDVDLAGRVEPTFGAFGSTHQRILDDLSYPELIISFQYSNAQGEVLASGEKQQLKKLAPMSTRRSALGSGRDNLYFEKELLTNWFKETLKK